MNGCCSCPQVKTRNPDGTINQEAQRLVADTGVEDFDANRMADSLVIEEATARFARQTG